MKHVVNGKVLDMSPEEIAEHIERIKVDPKKAESTLHRKCESYQMSMLGGRCNSNFFNLLMSARVISKITGQPLGPKATACFNWLDNILWKFYEDCKAAGNFNPSFKDIGSIPHSFDEIREELGE